MNPSSSPQKQGCDVQQSRRKVIPSPPKSHQTSTKRRRNFRNSPEIEVAKPHPPPQTSFHESPPSVAGRRMAEGERNGDLCGEAPGRYPHMNTSFSFLTDSIFPSSSPPATSMADSEGIGKLKTMKISETRRFCEFTPLFRFPLCCSASGCVVGMRCVCFSVGVGLVGTGGGRRRIIFGGVSAPRRTMAWKIGTRGVERAADSRGDSWPGFPVNLLEGSTLPGSLCLYSCPLPSRVQPLALQTQAAAPHSGLLQSTLNLKHYISHRKFMKGAACGYGITQMDGA
ncbi:hypothetical protein ACLOJK_012661 [Asimina triloba]